MADLRILAGIEEWIVDEELGLSAAQMRRVLARVRPRDGVRDAAEVHKAILHMFKKSTFIGKTVVARSIVYTVGPSGTSHEIR